MMFEQVQVLAEAGINHNADVDIALRLIDAAKDAGADVVKFQKRVPEIAVPKHMWDVQRETPWGVLSYIDYKRKMEFGKSEFDIIDSYCKSQGIPWTASAWDVPSVEFLEQYDIPFHKVPSACLTDDELLKRMCQTGIPIYLSTGMSTESEVFHSVGVLGKGGMDINDVVLMHCNSSYPCPTADLNLSCISYLQRRYPNITIGYSGHETGLATTIAAVALGARVIERHITLDRSMWGTDQAASVEPHGFAKMVKDIRNVETALGDGIKRVTEGEREAMKKLRRVYHDSHV